MDLPKRRRPPMHNSLDPLSLRLTKKIGLLVFFMTPKKDVCVRVCAAHFFTTFPHFCGHFGAVSRLHNDEGKNAAL